MAESLTAEPPLSESGFDGAGHLADNGGLVIAKLPVQ
jgi:hypothetical protein